MTQFTHIVRREDVTHSPKTVNLVASEDVRAALAGRFGLLSIDQLEGEVEISHLADGLRVKGHMDATVIQPCAISHKPVRSVIADDFSIHYCIGPLTEEQEESVLDADAEDVEELVNDEVDVAEILAQTLSLCLDPFPRAPGVALPSSIDTEDDAKEARKDAGPFAILKNLADKT